MCILFFSILIMLGFFLFCFHPAKMFQVAFLCFCSLPIKCENLVQSSIVKFLMCEYIFHLLFSGTHTHKERATEHLCPISPHLSCPFLTFISSGVLVFALRYTRQISLHSKPERCHPKLQSTPPMKSVCGSAALQRQLLQDRLQRARLRRRLRQQREERP